MNEDTPPSNPPPNYGAAPAGYQYPQPGHQYPQPGQPVGPTVVPTEPPPKYELPKEGPYAQQQPTGYPVQGPYPSGYQGQPVHSTIIVTTAGFGPSPRQMECPNCHAFVTTALNYQSGGLTWLSAGLLCLFGCWMGCCLIPFCINDLQDVEHRCPNCGRHVGTYSRL